MKTLYEVASFLRANMIALPEDFSVAGVPLEGFSDGLLRAGVRDAHALVGGLYAFLAENAAAYDHPVGKCGREVPALSVGYPALLGAFLLLYQIGCTGVPSQDGTALLVDRLSLRAGLKALRAVKVAAAADLLRAQGLDLQGDVARGSALTLACPAHPLAPLGLAAMARACLRYAKKDGDREVVTNRFLMRFDYHVLSGARRPTAPIEECLNAAPGDVRDFLLRLNARFVAEGCKRDMLSKLFTSKCGYRPKDMSTILFTIHASFGRCWLKLNAEHLAEYADILDGAPQALQTSVQDERWFCAKMQDPSACMPSCRGGVRFTFQGKECMPCRMGAFELPLEDDFARGFALRFVDAERERMMENTTGEAAK